MNIIDMQVFFIIALLGSQIGLDMDSELSWISTQTLPPRGPVGLEGLVTYKYFLKGNGNIVDDFSSGKAIFTHKDLQNF